MGGPEIIFYFFLLLIWLFIKEKESSWWVEGRTVRKKLKYQVQAYCYSSLIALQILCFITNWTFVATLYWATILAQFLQQHLLTFFVSVSQFHNSWNISKFSLLLYLYGDLWSVIMTHWKFRWWLVFFRNKVFFNLGAFIFSNSAIAHLI